MSNLKDKLRNKYESLFSDEAKIKAFDELAEHFYFGNFSTMSKSEIELLMFSIYLEKVLDKSEKDINAYSDYELSKIFGITQRRVANMKEKKQLKYPRDYNWREVFVKQLENIRYEKDCFVVSIRDVNLFREIENCIEARGGYLDIQLNKKILKVKEEYFIDLILNVFYDKADDKEKAVEEIYKIFDKSGEFDIDLYHREKSIGQIIKESAVENFPDILSEIIGKIIPFAGESMKPLVKDVAENMQKKFKQKNARKNNKTGSKSSFSTN